MRSLDQILYDDFAELSAARRDEDDRLVALVDGLDAAALARPIRYRRIIGEGCESVRASLILLTLFNHQTHHRGQIHAMLTRAGIVPAPWDIVFFLEDTGRMEPAVAME